MHYSVLPEKASRNKTFVQDSNNPDYAINESIFYPGSEFYYIGKNFGNAKEPINTFKAESSFELLKNAKSELLLSLTNKGTRIPEVIFCDSSFDVQSIRAFGRFLNCNPALSLIPFILDGSGVSEESLEEYRKNEFLDEIAFLNNSDDKNTLTKIRFFKKVKSRINEIKACSIQDETSPIQNLLKRIFDIVISAIALALLSPLFLVIALAIRVESGDPIFYISKRAGKGYKIFNFYKFRTMFVGSDERIGEFSHLNSYSAATDAGSSVFIKINNDPRITKVGSILRKTSLDELPQIMNVLLGDMSFVGNRPLPLYEAENLTTDHWAKRFMAPAGITGLWQIKKRGQENMSAEERIGIDIDYANNSSFVYDLWIMARTPSALFQKINT
jgi:lipopolysaccharide/colanic/teichoic acid biosynthesis glycosyltransferase